MNSVNDNRSLQFEVWQECNNRCTFCYLCEENKHTDKQMKIESMKNIIETISDEKNLEGYNCLGFIGGEFFQGQLRDKEVRDLFFKMMSIAADLYNRRVIRQVWVSATLCIGKQEDLYEMLKLFNDYEGVWITTSYDTIGRYHTQKMLDTWEYHMMKLHTEYPNIKINITTILTDDVITKYMNGELSFTAMMEKYGAYFFFKQPSPFIKSVNDDLLYTEDTLMSDKIATNKVFPKFFTTRKKFLKFLRLFRKQENPDMWNRLFNVAYRADTLIRNFNDGHRQSFNRNKVGKCDQEEFMKLPCGHAIVYSSYIDSKHCLICDKEAVSAFDV